METETLLNQLKSKTKVQILAFLGCPTRDFEGMTVKELSEATGNTQNNISKQLMDLRKIGLVIKEPKGRNRVYYLNLDLPVSTVNVVKAVINMNSEELIRKGNHEFHKFVEQK